MNGRGRPRKYPEVEVGQHYARWTVIATAPSTENGMLRWVVRCDCGRVSTVHEANLTGGRTRSCGCLLREELATRNRDADWRARHRAQRRNKRMTLTYKGQTHTVRQWAEVTGIRQATIYSRLRRDWTTGRALGYE